MAITQIYVGLQYLQPYKLTNSLQKGQAFGKDKSILFNTGHLYITCVHFPGHSSYFFVNSNVCETSHGKMSNSIVTDS